MVSVRILLGAVIAGFIVCSEVRADDLIDDLAKLSGIPDGESLTVGGEKSPNPLGEGGDGAVVVECGKSKLHAANGTGFALGNSQLPHLYSGDGSPDALKFGCLTIYERTSDSDEKRKLALKNAFTNCHEKLNSLGRNTFCDDSSCQSFGDSGCEIDHGWISPEIDDAYLENSLKVPTVSVEVTSNQDGTYQCKFILTATVNCRMLTSCSECRNCDTTAQVHGD